MTTWLKCHYGFADYRPAFDRFEEMFNAMHGPRDDDDFDRVRRGRRRPGNRLAAERIAIAA
jgi:hypothetical protein